MKVILLHFERELTLLRLILLILFCTVCRVDDIEDNSKLRRGIPGMYVHAFSCSDGCWQCISWPLYNAGQQFNEVGGRVNPSCSISHCKAESSPTCPCSCNTISELLVEGWLPLFESQVIK